jgi:SAM-dependent methyltransferase
MIELMQRLKRWVLFNWMYFRKPPWDTGITPPELQSFIAERPAGRALDLGCGTGTNLLTLAQAGWQVTGIDFAVRAVNQARRRMKKAGFAANVLLGDANRMAGVSGPFDLVLDIGCYHGLPLAMRAAYRENLLRVLAPDGHFLIYCHLTQTANAPFGLQPRDLEEFDMHLACLSRQDSLDRWGRTASWMMFGRRSGRG